LQKWTDKTTPVVIDSLLTAVNEFAILERGPSVLTSDAQNKALIQKVQKALGSAYCDEKKDNIHCRE